MTVPRLRFFRFWMVMLASLTLFVPVLAIFWGVGVLLDHYKAPLYVGAVVMMMLGTAISAWFMTSTRVKRWVGALMTWAEKP